VNLVLLEPGEIALGAVRLSGARAEHIRAVLAPAPGQRLRVGVIDGGIGTARVVSLGDDVVLDDLALGPPPAPPPVDLVLALPRPKVLARLLSPIAQLGCRRLVLTGAWKVERFYFDAHVLQPEALRAHLLEGLAQVKDTRLPEVTVHRSLAFLVKEELDALVPPTAQRIVLDPRGAPIEAVLTAASSAVLAIGPEGGFTGREDALLVEHGFVPGGLGPRTLRSDVAVLAALARVHAALG
jgi:16S rRNA (uracil1498-N3)-methyltransferase